VSALQDRFIRNVGLSIQERLELKLSPIRRIFGPFASQRHGFAEFDVPAHQAVDSFDERYENRKTGQQGERQYQMSTLGQLVVPAGRNVRAERGQP
jgi:hypothetical protein